MFTVKGAFVVLASLMPLAAADGFLAQPLPQQVVDDVLLSELASLGSAELEAVKEELRPMFTALPKTETGTLESTTVRYALHRYFVKKHGWRVKGLQDDTGGWDSAQSSNSIMKDRAPAYILSFLQKKLDGNGLGLHELSIFAASLSNLIHAESSGQLQGVFEDLGLPATGLLTEEQVKEALDAYLLTYLLGRRLKGFGYKRLWSRMTSLYQDFDATAMWYKDLVRTVSAAQALQGNPFVKPGNTYDSTLPYVQEVGHKFGSFQNLECHKLKNRMTNLEVAGSGRVPLSNFYSDTLNGGWHFTESVDYLRSSGALDESDPLHPSVIIPNYVNGYGNCLVLTGFYQVCCVNECEALLAQVEEAVASSDASPGRIAEVVSRMPSDTVDAPRNLSSALLSRLDDIAKIHNGRIPLHGRLFEQWMHHVYPRECPYPHVAEHLNLKSMNEWIKAYGSTDASQEEMRRFADRKPSNAIDAGDLPWDAVEQLVASNRVRPTLTDRRVFPYLAGFAALGSFVYPLLQAWMTEGKTSEGLDADEKKYFV